MNGMITKRYVELDYDALDSDQRKVYDDIVSGPRGRLLAPHQILLHAPAIAQPAQQLGAILRYSTGLAPAVTELVILTTACHWNAQYEWDHHAPLALTAGLSTDVLAAISDKASPDFECPYQDLAYRIAISILETSKIDENLFQDSLDQFGRKGLIEIISTIGYYTMLAFVLNSHDVLREASHRK